MASLSRICSILVRSSRVRPQVDSRRSSTYKPYWKRKNERFQKRKSNSASSELSEDASSTPLILRYINESTDDTSRNQHCQEEQLSNSQVKKEVSKSDLLRQLEEIKWDENAILERGKVETMLFERLSSEVEDIELETADLSGEVNKYLEKLSALRTTSSMPVEKSQMVVQMTGSPDPSVPMSSVPCCGCGAKLHCQDMGLPGYLPSEKFKILSMKELKQTECQRCHLLNHHNICLNVTSDEKEYEKILSRIKEDRTGLVLMVVDLTDIGNSVIKQFRTLLGKNRPLYIAGNKVDLIPKDRKDYLDNVKREVIEVCNKNGLNDSGKNLKHVCLVSAKTGYGIEQLVTKLMKDWSFEDKGNVYLVGATNSGKSTLFNALLRSDYCRSSVRDLIHRATVSVWPGTTKSLLSFPIVKVKPRKLYQRWQRLEEDQAEFEQKEEIRRNKLRAGGKSKNAVKIGYVGMTDFRSEELKKEEETHYRPTGLQFGGYEFSSRSHAVKYSQGQPADEEDKEKVLQTMAKLSAWLYDTPGLVNKEQIINKLNQDELQLIIPKILIRPRVFVVRPLQTMFISGLARLDYLEGGQPTYFTAFVSKDLPIHVVPTADADDFYANNLDNMQTFAVPIGASERLANLPSLVGHEFTIESDENLFATADIQLSSLGWVSLMAMKGTVMKLRAYTPGGLGVYERRPSMLNNLKAFRGQRIQGTAEFNFRKARV